MDPRTQKMAEVIINYSTAVKPGELVLLRGTSPLSQPLIQALYAEAVKAGGNALAFVHMSQEDEIVMTNGTVEQIAAVNPMLKLMYDTANVIVRVDSEENTKLNFPADKSQARIKAKGALLNIQSARE